MPTYCATHTVDTQRYLLDNKVYKWDFHQNQWCTNQLLDMQHL